MRKWKSLLLAPIILLGCSKKIEEKQGVEKISGNLTLEKTIEVAKKRSLNLKIRKIKKEISKLDRQISFGNFLPSINLFGGYAQMNDQIYLEKKLPFIGSLEMELIENKYSTYGANGIIPIFVPSLWYIYDSRRKGEKIEGIVYDLSEKIVELEVIENYCRILTLEKQREFYKNEKIKSEKLLKKMKVALEVEAILPWEYKKGRLYSDSIDLYLDRNLKEIEIEKMKLLEKMNLPLFSNIELEDVNVNKKMGYSLNQSIYLAIENNDKLKILREKNKIDNNMVKIAFANFLPKIVISTGYLGDTNKIWGDPDILYGNISGFLSIFNGFKNIKEYQKAKKMKKISDLELEKELHKIVIEVTTIYKELEVLEKYMKITLDKVEMLEEKLRTAKIHYELGEIDELEYFNTMSEYKKGKFEYFETQKKYIVLEGMYRVILGFHLNGVRK